MDVVEKLRKQWISDKSVAAENTKLRSGTAIRPRRDRCRPERCATVERSQDLARHVSTADAISHDVF